MAPSHYLNQCWLMISDVLWHSAEGNFTGNSLLHIYPWYEFENYSFNITTASPWAAIELNHCVTLKFDGCLSSNAAETPVKYQSNWTILNTNLLGFEFATPCILKGRNTCQISEQLDKSFGFEFARPYILKRPVGWLHVFCALPTLVDIWATEGSRSALMTTDQMGLEQTGAMVASNILWTFPWQKMWVFILKSMKQKYCHVDEIFVTSSSSPRSWQLTVQLVMKM